MTVIAGLARRFQAPLFASAFWGVTWAVAFILYTIVNFFWLSGSTATLPKMSPGVLIECLVYGVLGALSGLACSFLLPPDSEGLENVSIGRVAVFGALASLSMRVLLGKLVMWGLVSGLNTSLILDLGSHLPSFAGTSLFFTAVGAVSSSGTLHLARRSVADRLLVGEAGTDLGSSIRQTDDKSKGILPR